MAEESEKAQAPRQFGIFYPRGYVVIAFEKQAEADQMRRLLIDGGYDENDIKSLSSEQVLQGASDDLRELSPLIKALGDEALMAKSHVASAAKGHTFLVAYAPSDLDTERLMNVARRVGYAKAQKYDRFTVSEL
ncbi:MAG: hypothetical protein ABI766_05585 [Gemmatimonadales bacterium]